MGRAVRRWCFAKLKKVDSQDLNTNSPEVSQEEALPAPTLEDQLAGVTAERDRLAAEKAELQDRLLRTRAEFDNARRRAERERSDFLQFSAMDLVRDLLPVLDDFERALKVEGASPDYARGVGLIYQRLYETLKKMGLEPIETVGRGFDPNLHEAVQRVETTEAEDQTVLGEFQRGYNFKGRLLRPAMVKVAVKP
ncbi:MAG TPA: nucleotide exchange factor GrpE [Bryobacteraceae bacterium]|nr:nucleotide exchange factor GrpE [Bryobacteraceae bacterium]